MVTNRKVYKDLNSLNIKKMSQESLEYKTINPEGDYNSQDIIQHYEDFQDINEYLQALQKDSENVNVWEKAGELLHGGNKLFYTQSKTSPRLGLEKTLSEESNKLAKYADKNSSTIFGKLEPESYAELIQKVPLYKTGNKEHDDFVELMNNYRKVTEAGQDINKMTEYVQKKVMDSDCSDGIKMELLANIYNERYIQVQFQGYMNLAKAELDEKTYDANKNVKTGFLEKIFKNSLDEAEAELRKEDYSESEKNDILEANIRPYKFALLEEAYKKEKGDEDKPQGKEDRDKRRKDRREKGMAF